MTDVGALRHRLIWQTPPIGRDAMLGPAGDWVTRGEFWAKVEPLGGRELYNARQLKATSTHKITMRGGVEIRPGHRLVFQDTNRVFNVDVANRTDERTAYLAIQATEQQGGQ